MKHFLVRCFIIVLSVRAAILRALRSTSISFPWNQYRLLGDKKAADRLEASTVESWYIMQVRVFRGIDFKKAHSWIGVGKGLSRYTNDPTPFCVCEWATPRDLETQSRPPGFVGEPGARVLPILFDSVRQKGRYKLCTDSNLTCSNLNI